jgi:hypothetical protein
MYNEDEVLFLRTLYGVMKNISHLCARQNSSWGRDGWKKVRLRMRGSALRRRTRQTCSADPAGCLFVPPGRRVHRRRWS